LSLNEVMLSRWLLTPRIRFISADRAEILFGPADDEGMVRLSLSWRDRGGESRKEGVDVEQEVGSPKPKEEKASQVEEGGEGKDSEGLPLLMAVAGEAYAEEGGVRSMPNSEKKGCCGWSREGWSTTVLEQEHGTMEEEVIESTKM
jgi:hypothetical protein